MLREDFKSNLTAEAKPDTAHLLEGYGAGGKHWFNRQDAGRMVLHSTEGALVGLLPGVAHGLSKLDAHQKASDWQAASTRAEKIAAFEVSRIDSTPVFFKPIVAGVLKGAAAAGITAGFDMALQKTFGNSIGGHDLFKPSMLETSAMAVTAAVPIAARIKVGLAAASWLAGRVENYYRN